MPTPITQYAQPSDLSAYGISDDAIAAMDPDVVEESLKGSSDVINSSLRQRFTLPLFTVDRAVKRACCVLTVYDLMVVRGYNPSAGADENLLLRVKSIETWLKQVASGLMTPEVTDSSVTPAPAGTDSTRAHVTSASSRGWSGRGSNVFGRTPGGFVSD